LRLSFIYPSLLRENKGERFSKIFSCGLAEIVHLKKREGRLEKTEYSLKNMRFAAITTAVLLICSVFLMKFACNGEAWIPWEAKRQGNVVSQPHAKQLEWEAEPKMKGTGSSFNSISAVRSHLV
jgi:hypothetical protein